MREWICIVVEVKILGQFVEVILKHDFLDSPDSNERIIAPIKSSCRQLFDPKQHMKAKKCLDFLKRCVKPFWVWLFSNIFMCIVGRLSHCSFHVVLLQKKFVSLPVIKSI